MPNADVILMLECSLRFPGVLVRRVRELYRGADGRATEKSPLAQHPGFQASGRARTPAQNHAEF